MENVYKENEYIVCLLLLNSIFCPDLEKKRCEDPVLYEIFKNTSPPQCPLPYLNHTLRTYLRSLDFCSKGRTRFENTELKRIFWRNRRPCDEDGESFTVRSKTIYNFSMHSHDNKTKVDGTEGQAGRRVKQDAREIKDANFRSKNYREIRCEDNVVGLAG
jgi:hypothetical protein